MWISNCTDEICTLWPLLLLLPLRILYSSQFNYLPSKVSKCKPQIVHFKPIQHWIYFTAFLAKCFPRKNNFLLVNVKLRRRRRHEAVVVKIHLRKVVFCLEVKALDRIFNDQLIRCNFGGGGQVGQVNQIYKSLWNEKFNLNYKTEKTALNDTLNLGYLHMF